MLKRLFTSNTRIKLLTLFVMNPDGEFFIRELTRKLEEQINSVRRELDNLKRLGFLKSKAKNRKKYYVVNKEFIIFEELRNIIIKALSSREDISNELKKMGDVKVVVLSGQFVDKDSSVDMLIVGNLDKDKLASYINGSLRTARPVKFTIMTEQDYSYRISCNDKFIKDIISDPDNQILIKKI